MSRLVLKNFLIADEAACFPGSVIVEGGRIARVIPDSAGGTAADSALGETPCRVIDGKNFAGIPALMPAFIDLHAHFRDSGEAGGAVPFPAETLESGCLAAAAGGYGTVICMANTKPPVDTTEKARALKERADVLDIIDLFPAVSLTENMDGRMLCGIEKQAAYIPLLLSEDGKDIPNDELFLAAMKQARDLGIPVSCHCDFGGQEAEEAKAAGKSRAEWSRIEENNAVRRVIELGKKAGCHIHIAHVSTKEAAEYIRYAKQMPRNGAFRLTCEASPHHIGASETDARRMGEETFGRVNPPLRAEADRAAIIAALCDGTIDAIATDHAPHSEADKAAGAPGFAGLETAFSACLSYLSAEQPADSAAPREMTHNVLRLLSTLMSANPARIIALDTDRGRIAKGFRADLVIADIEARQKIDTARFASRGKCSPFNGQTLRGKILMTIHNGRVVFDGGQ